MEISFKTNNISMYYVYGTYKHLPKSTNNEDVEFGFGYIFHPW